MSAVSPVHNIKNVIVKSLNHFVLFKLIFFGNFFCINEAFQTNQFEAKKSNLFFSYKLKKEKHNNQ